MTRALNPLAPEYNPIPPGISPHLNHNSPTFFFRPPPSPTDFPPPPLLPPFPPSQIYTYIPSSTSHYPTYYVDPHQIPCATSSTSTNIPHPPAPPPPPPPQAQAVAHHRRGFTGQRGGFFPNFGRLNRPSYYHSERKRVGNENKYFLSHRRMRDKERRHQVMPLKLGEDQTVMIKNVPYSCSRKDLIIMLDRFCSLQNAKAKTESTSAEENWSTASSTAAYDILYLPIDFRTKKSVGYAFVNFTTAGAACTFHDCFHLKPWDSDYVKYWPKKIEIARADYQGKEEMVNKLSEITLECERDEYLPVCFNPARDGSGQPVELTVIGNRRGTATTTFRWERRRINHEA